MPAATQPRTMAEGSIGRWMFSLAAPAVVAQVINLLYNVVDRIYIGHMPGVGATALTGVGLCMPILMLVNAFAMLAGAGQHGKGVDQHEDGHAQPHAGQGGGAHPRHVADVDAVHHVVQKVDDLGHHGGCRQAEHPAADAAFGHGAGLGCCGHDCAFFPKNQGDRRGGRCVYCLL